MKVRGLWSEGCNTERQTKENEKRLSDPATEGGCYGLS